MAATAQLNVRMEPELKASGEAVLDRMGLTSTQVIRALWMKISRGAEAVDQIIEVLARDPSAVGDLDRPDEAARQGLTTSFDGRLQAFYHETRLDPSAYVPPTEEEWDEWVLQDAREQERERLTYHAD